MTFKIDWEQPNRPCFATKEFILRILDKAYPGINLVTYKIMSGGCRNLNIKLILEGFKSPCNLRICLQDELSIKKESKILNIVSDNIPVPDTYHIGCLDSYDFSITEYINGISLSQMLLVATDNDVASIMNKVSKYLTLISQKKFTHSGFFDSNLNIQLGNNKHLLGHIDKCLNSRTTQIVLSSNIIDNIKICIDRNLYYLPNLNEKSLVHGDFDPANILVNKIGNEWDITGILDWEFSFSGSSLWDISNMLRYSHKMPPIFGSSFLQGLKENGFVLNDNWHKSQSLLNLFSLLDCLVRSNIEKQPNRCEDILELIVHFITILLDKTAKVN